MEHNIEQSVLEKIRKGEVSMRPKAYFVAKIALVALLSAMTLLLSLFVLSFIVWSIHESGERFLLGFGGRGLSTFIALFPWTTFALVILLILALEWMFRRFMKGYRLPILRIFLALAALVALGSIALSITPLHTSLLEKADRDELPVLGDLYEGVHDSHAPSGVYRGDVGIIDASSGTFTISHDDHDRDQDDGLWRVVPPEGFDLGSLSSGEKVYVAGDREGGNIRAYGIGKLEERGM